jgi:hypothetical protein
MKDGAVVLLFLSVVALHWAVAAPALGYYPPLQDIIGPTVVQTTDTKVNVSVHDSATGQDIPGVWTTAGGTGAIAIDQITKNQGMVAWRVHDLVNHKYQVVAGVYDPNPQQGWQFFNNFGSWQDHAPVILALNDGVLLYETQYTTPPEPFAYSVTIEDFVTYDPAREIPGQPMIVGWRTMSWSWTSLEQGGASGHVVKDGAAAVVYYSPGWGYSMNWLIYDSRVHAWMSDSASPDNPTAPSITNATVTWTDDAGAQKRGYDYIDTTWKTGQDTKVMANFVFAPFEPRPGQFVYFTDMSIAANAWIYMTGDGFTIGLRSLYHKYANAGQYTAKQDVVGLAGFDTISKTVPVKAPSTSGSILLLLLN